MEGRTSFGEQQDGGGKAETGAGGSQEGLSQCHHGLLRLTVSPGLM